MGECSNAADAFKLAGRGESPMNVVAVIQHTSGEYLGLMEDHLEGRRIRFQYFRPFASGGKLPAGDLPADHSRQPLPHLAGRLVREADRDDPLRRYALLEQMDDTGGDDARLARPRAGENQQRAFGGFDGLALTRIEVAEVQGPRVLTGALSGINRGVRAGRDCRARATAISGLLGARP